MVAYQVIPQKTSVYLQEAAELLQQIDTELQTLHQDFCVQKVYTLTRLVHTLKGAAATVGLDVVNITTQTLENAFKALCAPDVSLTSTVEGLIFEAYGCLKLLLSGQLDQVQVDELAVLDRVTDIDAQLQDSLGERFGQDHHLPDSTQLGTDITQSIFETGVSEYLDELSCALVARSTPSRLAEILRVQADVFIGLAESLDVPEFGKIAQSTLADLKQHPDRVVSIARQALDNYRVGQAMVLLQRDRNPQPRYAAAERAPLPAAAVTAQPQPLSRLFQHCRQALDRLTQEHDKPVLIHLKSNNILIEPSLARQICKPLTYLIHHAFYRDIERAEVRRQQGKSAQGTIQLAAKQTQCCLVICVWDNGCGLNPEPIRQRMQPYVNKTLKGAIASTAYPGKGTCFTLTIPTSA